MKPDWDTAPAWARWVAMDRSGQWYWYETCPTDHDEVWDNGGKSIEVSRAAIPRWRDTLQSRL